MFTTNLTPETPTPAMEITVVITSAKIDGVEQSEDYRLKLPKDAVTELMFELHDSDGNLLPITDSFAVPIQQLKGAVVDSLALNFTDGKAALTETWFNSGEFVITQELLNTYIDNTQQLFLFRGIAFSVYR
jgi:hypothetical protein